MATDQEKNLKVLTDHLLKLAETQRTAAVEIAGATTAVQTAAGQVSATHGIVCEATHLAVSAAYAARAAGGRQMQKTSEELDLKLTDASEYYEKGDDIGKQMITHATPR